MNVQNNSSAPLKTAEGAPVGQWQKRHPNEEGGAWQNTNRGDAMWWRDNSQGWEIRALYEAAPQAMAAQAPAAVHTKLSADAGRLAYVADQIRALEPVGSEGDVFLTEVIQVLKDCAEAMATPALPATEDSSAGDLATESVLIEGVAYTIPEPVALELLRLNIELQLAEVQAEPVADCYSDDDGDTWRDLPSDIDFVQGRKLGEEFELQASVRSWSETFRVTKVPDETSDDYEVEPVSVRTGPQAQPAFQQRVWPWMMECFGAEIAADRIERNHRFLEEALELVQATGCTKYEAFKLVNYVFKRPVGKPAQEVGGVMVTLAAHCQANGLDMQTCAETELERIWTKVPEIRAKQAAKPKHSPLPISQDAEPLDEISEALHDYHYALDTRQHGGVAAGTAINAIEAVLDMHWQQGQETNRRAAMAAAKPSGTTADQGLPLLQEGEENGYGTCTIDATMAAAQEGSAA